MSSLKDGKRLSNREIGQVIGDAISTMVEQAFKLDEMSRKGRQGFTDAKAKMEGLTINPMLEKALERIVPKGLSVGFKLGAELLEEDVIWTVIVSRLTDVKFEKRGMAAYFVNYLLAMAQTSSYVDLRKMVDTTMRPLDGHFGSMMIKDRLDKKFEQGERIVSVLFGYLATLEEEYPDKPQSFGKWIYSWFWKNAGGATASDFARAREIADKFLAESMSNDKIFSLAIERRPVRFG